MSVARTGKRANKAIPTSGPGYKLHKVEGGWVVAFIVNGKESPENTWTFLPYRTSKAAARVVKFGAWLTKNAE